jgi:hypothetical protein
MSSEAIGTQSINPHCTIRDGWVRLGIPERFIEDALPFSSDRPALRLNYSSVFDASKKKQPGHTARLRNYFVE